MRRSKTTHDDDTLSLFDIEENKAANLHSGKLDVVKMDYLGAESLTWQELFSGYNHLYYICKDEMDCHTVSRADKHPVRIRLLYTNMYLKIMPLPSAFV